MKYYITLMFFCISAIALAQVPMLDSSTIQMPKSKALNKCIDENNKIVYTQFECSETATKADKQWIDQTNITFSTPTQKEIILQNGLPYPVTGKGSEQFNHLDPNQSGMDMLKDRMKDKSLMELFDQGVKALMMRQDMLDSL